MVRAELHIYRTTAKTFALCEEWGCEAFDYDAAWLVLACAVMRSTSMGVLGCRQVEIRRALHGSGSVFDGDGVRRGPFESRLLREPESAILVGTQAPISKHIQSGGRRIAVLRRQHHLDRSGALDPNAHERAGAARRMTSTPSGNTVINKRRRGREPEPGRRRHDQLLAVSSRCLFCRSCTGRGKWH